MLFLSLTHWVAIRRECHLKKCDTKISILRGGPREHPSALQGPAFARPWFRGMLKGKQLLNHWPLMPTSLVPTSHFSCKPLVVLFHVILSSLPNSQVLSLFQLSLALDSGKQGWHCSMSHVYSNVCNRWVHYLPTGSFGMIHFFIYVAH